MLLAEVFTETTFYAWFRGGFVWGVIAVTFVVLVPLIVEVVQTCKQAYYNRAWVRKGGMERLEESSTMTPSPSLGEQPLKVGQPVTIARPQIQTMDAGSLKSGVSYPESSTMGKGYSQ